MDKKLLIEMIAAFVAESGSQRKASTRLGLSQQYLNDVLTGKREPGAKILDALDIERIVLYKQRGKE